MDQVVTRNKAQPAIRVRMYSKSNSHRNSPTLHPDKPGQDPA
jgi:hypothetical protein